MPAYEFGLYVYRANERHGSGTRLSVEVVKKSDDGKSIRNLNQEDFIYDSTGVKSAKGRTYAGLAMKPHVYVASDEKRMIGHEVAYYDLYCVEARQAILMADTFKAYAKARTKWCEQLGNRMEAEDVFALLAKFVGASFVVFQDLSGPGRRGNDYDSMSWTFNPVRNGIDLFRAAVKKEESAAPDYKPL